MHKSTIIGQPVDVEEPAPKDHSTWHGHGFVKKKNYKYIVRKHLFKLINGLSKISSFCMFVPI